MRSISIHPYLGGQVTTRITPKSSTTLSGQTYQQYTDVYGLCPKVVTTLNPSTVAACATGERFITV